MQTFDYHRIFLELSYSKKLYNRLNIDLLQVKNNYYYYK